VKKLILADITREAEARRAVVMKTTLNCIMVTWCSFEMSEKKWSELKVIRLDDEQEAWEEGPGC